MLRDVAEPDKFRIDHVISFGFASGPGNAGQVMDATVAILKAEGVDDISKWVDDFMFYRTGHQCGSGVAVNTAAPERASQLTHETRSFIVSDAKITTHSTLAESRAAIPVPYRPGDLIPLGCTVVEFTYGYTVADIVRITAPLRFPWAEAKWQMHAFENTFLGFTWDVWHRRVSIPDSKRIKYVGRVHALLSATEAVGVGLKALEQCHGSLMHITFVMRDGLSRLPALQRFINGFKLSYHVRHRLTPAARSDLKWWQSALGSPGAFRTLVDRGEPVERGISVDASKTFGIGIRTGNQYKAWKWKRGALGPGARGRDIGGAEAIALEMAIRYLRAMGVRGEFTAMKGDNTSTIAAFDRGRGRNVWTNESVRRSRELLQEMDGEVAVTYVKSADNPADQVSRGDFTGLTRLPCTFAVPDELCMFMTEV